MKRRGFLSTLLLPFLPTPQLPMEQEFFEALRVPFIPLRTTNIFKLVVEDRVVATFINLRAVRKLQVYSEPLPVVGDEPVIYDGPWPKVEQF